MSEQSTEEEILRRVPLFRGLDRKHLERMARLMTRLAEPAGKVLAREGAYGAEFFIIHEGEVEVRQAGTLVTTCGPGDYLGEIALLAGRPRTAELVTKTPVVLEVLSSREFNTLLADEPTIATQIMATMAERLAELEGRTLT
jgi:CRP-like cAMP-binding protein